MSSGPLGADWETEGDDEGEEAGREGEPAPPGEERAPPFDPRATPSDGRSGPRSTATATATEAASTTASTTSALTIDDLRDRRSVGRERCRPDAIRTGIVPGEHSKPTRTMSEIDDVPGGCGRSGQARWLTAMDKQTVREHVWAELE